MNCLKHWLVRSVLLAAISIAAGCATTTLKPAADAQPIAGDADAAVARSDGIEIVAETNEWSGFPPRLEREITPLRATITNNSNRPLKIEYDNFSLSGVEGVTFHPLPPIDIKGSVTQTSPYPIIAPRFAYHGFLLSPYFRPYFIGPNVWTYAWTYDPIYYRRYYPRWEIDLPTHEMIEQAIPEGVIEPKGQLSGFFYFPELDAAQEGDRLTFTASLVDAKTNDTFGKIAIPFVME